MLPGPPHDLVDNQEEFGEIGLLDDVQLRLQPLRDQRGERAVAAPDLVLAEAVEDREGGLALGDGEAREADLGEVEVEAALRRDAGGMFKGVGVPSKPPPEAGFGEQTVLAIGDRKS